MAADSKRKASKRAIICCAHSIINLSLLSSSSLNKKRKISTIESPTNTSTSNLASSLAQPHIVQKLLTSTKPYRLSPPQTSPPSGQPSTARMTVIPTWGPCHEKIKMDLSSLSQAKIPDDIANAAKEAHFRRSRIYDDTKVTIRHRTRKMFVTASRGFQRDGFVPTQLHRPRLTNRRYSVDVSTNEGNGNILARDTRATLVPYYGNRYHETDGNILRAPTTPLPNHLRFHRLHYPFPDFVDDTEETFLELENSSLSNEDFNTIGILEGYNCFFRDGILNVALELVLERYDCKARGIEITNTFISNILFQVGKNGDVDENNFANYKDEKKRFENKKWIFLPVNDGMLINDLSSDVHGTHWAFIVVDCLAQEAVYIDSWWGYNKRPDPENLQAASTIVCGLGYITGQNLCWLVDDNVPDQYKTNSCTQDRGPCGPFVVTAIEHFVSKIVRAQNAGREHECWATFPDPKSCLKPWVYDSGIVRLHIATEILTRRNLQAARLIAAQNDQIALAGTNCVLEPPQPPVQQPLPKLDNEDAMEVYYSESEYEESIEAEEESIINNYAYSNSTASFSEDDEHLHPVGDRHRSHPPSPSPSLGSKGYVISASEDENSKSVNHVNVSDLVEDGEPVAEIHLSGGDSQEDPDDALPTYEQACASFDTATAVGSPAACIQCDENDPKTQGGIALTDFDIAAETQPANETGSSPKRVNEIMKAFDTFMCETAKAAEDPQTAHSQDGEPEAATAVDSCTTSLEDHP